ncbi:Rhodopsin domain-containing protein [Madurella fahalii]|uniref:Rhodopsin domain-containing protein n=1 Tax=Madurella fahalii TaxID=1157608 RepID=A0ABQ0GCV9_9PEZI
MAEQPTTIRIETNGPLVTGIAVGFVSATALFVAGRLYTRGVLIRSIGKDDWSMLIATVLSLVNSIAMCLEVKYGMGRHSENVRPEESLEQLKFLLVAILTYNMGMNVVKLGFLFQYRRIFQDAVIQRICYWFIIYVCIWACVQAVLLGLACLPISIIVPTMAGSCLDTLPFWYFSSGMSMATDILIFCIPIPSVLKLHLPLKQRLIVVGIFCLGFFVCIISIYRMFTLRAGVISQDPSWENIGVAIWSCIELNVAIIASTLPTLRPLVTRILPGFGLSSAHHSPKTYLRYGSASAAMRAGAFQSAENRRNKAQSISTEELALEARRPSPTGSIPAGISGRASVDPAKGFFPERDTEKGRIVMTTEIWVDSHAR